MIRPGAQEVRDVQNLVELIADPYGDGRFQEFWDRRQTKFSPGSSTSFMPNLCPSKTLARVFRIARPFRRHGETDGGDASSQERNQRRGLETHPEVKRAAHFLTRPTTKLRAGIKATAESYLGLFADPLVRHQTRRRRHSAFQTSCAPEEPVTLYLCWPPNDAKRVKSSYVSSSPSFAY